MGLRHKLRIGTTEGTDSSGAVLYAATWLDDDNRGFITAADDPVLAALWDNDNDSVYDDR